MSMEQVSGGVTLFALGVGWLGSILLFAPATECGRIVCHSMASDTPIVVQVQSRDPRPADLGARVSGRRSRQRADARLSSASVFVWS